MSSTTERPDAHHADGYTRLAGHSATAGTALLISLIALGLALYAAFAPRNVVRENSQTVMSHLDKLTSGKALVPGQSTGTSGHPAPLTGEQVRDIVVKETRQELEALKKDIAKLQSELEAGGKPASAPPQGKPASKP